MNIPQTPAELFETWLPTRFGEFLATPVGKAITPNERCTVHVDVGGQCWLLQVKDRHLTATAAAPETPASLRLQVGTSTLERFVFAELANLPAMPEEVPASSPLLKLLRLDDESLALVQNIPGSLELVVKDGETRYSARLGPGSRPTTPAACTLTCSLADAELLRAGKAQAMELFFGGRILLEGDPQVAMGLAGLFM